MAFSVLDALGRIKQFNVPSVFTTTTTGNIDDLNFLNADLIRMNNATLSTIRGLKAGYAGQKVTIVSIGAGQVSLAHQDGNSAAGNRLLNTVTSVSTPLAGGVGFATYQYDATTLRWRLVNHEQGAYITVPYDSANFTAATGTWTVDSGDQLAFGYWIRGRECIYTIDLASTSLSNATVTIRVTLAGMPVVVVNKFIVVWVSDAGVDVTTLVEASTSHDTKLYFYKFGGGNWGVQTNTLRCTAAGSYGIT